MVKDKDSIDSDKLSFALWKHGSDAHEAGHIEAAIHFYEQACQMGNTDALNNLAAIYDSFLKPPRHRDAVLLYKKAVNLGSSVAAWNLAMHYRNLKKHRWYKHWLMRAAQMGDDDAIELLRSNIHAI